MTTNLITQSGQRNVKFGEHDIGAKYRQGDTVAKDGSVWTANDDIDAGTPFTIGATGATWSSLVQGLPASGITQLVNGSSSVDVLLDGSVIVTVGSTEYTIAEDSISVTASASPAPYLSGFSSASFESLAVIGNSDLGTVGNVRITGGTEGQVLGTDGLGTLSWVDGGGGEIADVWLTIVADRLGSPVFPTAGLFTGTTYLVTDEGSLVSALSTAVDGDIIQLSADITLASTLNVTVAVKFTGGFAIQSAGTSTDPVTLILVTAPAYFDDTITIKHRKTSNTTLETAIRTDTLGFVSNASVEFMEFGYLLRGSFSIGGTLTYTGVLGNSHRHIAIYHMSAISQINGVVFDFPSESTARANLIVVLVSSGADRFDSLLRVTNCSHDLTKYCRQFFFIETLVQTAPRNASLWFDNNSWDDLNGGIGMISSTDSLLDQFSAIVLYKNSQGTAAEASYKGLMFIDGSGTFRSLGAPTILAVAHNNSPQVLRADYSTAIQGAIAYKNTVYSTPANLRITFGASNPVDSTSGYAIGYRDIPQIIMSSSVTLSLADAGKHYYKTDATDLSVTVPANSSVPFALGTAVTIVNQSTNNITINPAAGVTMYITGNSTPGTRTISSYGIATLMKVSNDTWFVTGGEVS